MKDNQLITTIQVLDQHALYAFDHRTLARLTGMTPVQSSQLLKRMIRAGIVSRVEKGKYLLLGLSPEQVLSNPLFIGNCLVSPSYVSFWSALHHYGFTEQAPRRVYLAVTMQKRKIAFRQTQFTFVHTQPAHFWGYRREEIAGLPVIIADEAKAILDSLYLPEYAGGVAGVAAALRNALLEGSGLELPMLVEYANRYRSPTLSARLGYLLEALGHSADGLAVGRGPYALDPQSPRRGAFSPRWRLYANVPPERLFPPGVR